MSKNRMEYKDYLGTVEWHDDEGIFKGEVLLHRNCISYEGKTIEELRNNFHKSIDNYIEVCEKNNLKREIPFKGSFNVRISDELYKKVYEKSKKDNISINKIINNALKEYIDSFYLY